MFIDETSRGHRVVPHRGQLLVGVALEHARSLPRQRTVLLARLPPPEISQFDQHLVSIGRVAHPMEESAALQSIDERRRRSRGEPDGGRQLAGVFGPSNSQSRQRRSLRLSPSRSATRSSKASVLR
jgi:hypothetical protein